MEKYEHICVTLRDGWEAIIHYDVPKFDVNVEEASTFAAGERYGSGHVYYFDLGHLEAGEVTLRGNPASERFSEANLQQLVKKFIEKIILPTRSPL